MKCINIITLGYFFIFLKNNTTDTSLRNQWRINKY
jgi:hypothetical protein